MPSIFLTADPLSGSTDANTDKSGPHLCRPEAHTVGELPALWGNQDTPMGSGHATTPLK